MDAFAVPFVVFAGGLTWLLVEMFRGSIDDPYPLRAGVTWAITCPLSGLLFVIGLVPIGIVVGTVSMLALGSLAYWFLGHQSDDRDDDVDEHVEPDPGPSDDEVIEIPAWALRAEEKPEPKSDIDWDAFDRLREEWEKEITRPVAPEPEREPVSTEV
ncbi:MAG TPA: hypothetical protein VNA28_11310 [Solirubrobacteraceae bacterium]|nr:hypothetical protein [Solirubrobacteraceae bacterium]